MDKSIERFDSDTIEIQRELDETDQSTLQEIEKAVKQADYELLSEDEREQILTRCNNESSALQMIQKDLTLLLGNDYTSEDMDAFIASITDCKNTDTQYSDAILEVCRPSTEDEYALLLERHQHLRESATFAKDDHYARGFFRMKTVLESGEISHLSLHTQCKLLAERFFVKYGTVQAWIMMNKVPRLVGLLGRLEHKRLGFQPESNQERRQYFPKTVEEYNALLARHPHVTEHPNFEQRDYYGRMFFEIIRIRESGEHIPFSKLERRFNIPIGAIFAWYHNRSVPDIFHQLGGCENQFVEYEKKIPPEAKSHLIHPVTVYDTLRPLKDESELSEYVLTEHIQKFCEMMEDKNVVFIELKPFHRKQGPEWLLNIGSAVESELADIEKHLNEKLSDEQMRYRLGYAGRTLYIWRKQVDRYGYLSLFNDECFYFKNHDRRNLLEKSRRHLNIKGNYILSQLLRQITDIDDTSRSSETPVAADLRHDRDHLFGETLRFLLDVTGKELTEIEPMIQAIGQQEQVKNPRIIEGENLLELMARLFAITASDGHVGNLWNFLGYHEYNVNRVEIVKKLVQNLGEVRWSYFYDGDKITGLRFPHVLGRLMKKLGIPTGDKSIQSYGLPDFILNGSPRIMAAYLQEMIPEDGCVKIYGKSQSIGINRNAILYDLEKGEIYGFDMKISEEHISLIKKEGRRMKGLVEGRILFIGKLRRLVHSEDHLISKQATELMQIALDNPIPLLIDEHRIIEFLSINCPEPRISQINWHKKTNRVSVTWCLNVSDQISIAKWCLLALPHDERKRLKMLEWVSRKPDVVAEARRQLIRDGLLTK